MAASPATASDSKVEHDMGNLLFFLAEDFSNSRVSREFSNVHNLGEVNMTQEFLDHDNIPTRSVRSLIFQYQLPTQSAKAEFLSVWTYPANGNTGCLKTPR